MPEELNRQPLARVHVSECVVDGPLHRSRPQSVQQIVVERIRGHTEVGIRSRSDRMFEIEPQLVQHNCHTTDQLIRAVNEQRPISEIAVKLPSDARDVDTTRSSRVMTETIPAQQSAMQPRRDRRRRVR